MTHQQQWLIALLIVSISLIIGSAYLLWPQNPNKEKANANTLTTHLPTWSGYAIGALIGCLLTLVIMYPVMRYQSKHATQNPEALADITQSQYQALLILATLGIQLGDHENILKGWEFYLSQPLPRKMPPQIEKATQRLQEAIERIDQLPKTP